MAGPPQDAPASPEHVAATLREILTREGIPQPPPNNWFADWLASLFTFSAETEEMVGRVALVLAVAVLVATLVMLFRSIRRHGLARRDGSDAIADEPPAALLRRHVGELRRRARAAEEAGDWVLALRLEFFALAVGLGESGALEYRDAWTNRELLERGHPRPEVRERLLPILGDLDAKTFGGAACVREDVRRMAELTDQLLMGEAS